MYVIAHRDESMTGMREQKGVHTHGILSGVELEVQLKI